MRASFLAVLLLASSALAGWKSTSVAGTPQDITVPDAGMSVVATTGGPGVVSYLATSTTGFGAFGQVLAGNYLSGVLRGPCLIGATPIVVGNTYILADSNCANENYLANNGFGARLRSTGAGDLYAATYNSTSGLQKFEVLPAGIPPGVTNWNGVALGSMVNANGYFPLSAMTSDAGEWAVVGPDLPRLMITRGKAIAGSAGVGYVRDVSLFAVDGRAGAVLVTDGGALLISEDLSVPDGGFVDTTARAAFSSVTFSALSGNANGRGFGMATAGAQLYGVVPNPNALGRQWVVRSGGGNGLTRISCPDPTYCAGIISDGGQNVWAYFNTGFPGAQVTPATVAAGGISTYVLDAGDPDGDPIWVTWTSSPNLYWDGGDPRTITILGPAGGGVCAPPPPPVAPLVATLSDGYAAHDQTVSVPVTVTGGGTGLPALTANPGALSLVAGGDSGFVTVAFGDSGCPLPAITWSISPDGGFTINAMGDKARINPPATFCNFAGQTFNLTATDGADASVTVPVTLQPWGQPLTPTFQMSLVQFAGTDASYSPMPGVHACELAQNFPGADLRWAVDAGGLGVTVVTSANALTVYSTNACVSGRVFATADRQVNGVVPPQVSPGSGVLDVQLVPSWGPPLTPVFGQSPVQQPAGSIASYFPDAGTHLCSLDSKFPGTDLRWTVDAGGSGVSVMTTSSALTVTSANACASGWVVATADRQVRGFTPLQVSPGSGSLVVKVVSALSPITAATGLDAGFAYDPANSQLTGYFTTDANCQAERDLRASVDLSTADGGAIASKSGIAVPGSWLLGVPGGCAGGSFVATARFVDDAGVRYGPTATYPFATMRLPARVPPLTVDAVKVSCEGGAAGELEVAYDDAGCAVQQLSWQQDRGPLLLVAPDGGSKVSFATAIHDLQGQAGQDLSFAITASIGPGNTETVSRSVRLVPDKFVEIRHRTDVPKAREEETVGVDVILTNTTSCPVTGLVLEENLGGLTPVAGSVRVGGVKTEAAIANGVLTVQGLALPAAPRSIHVTYLARVPLLSAARPTAIARFGGTNVTTAGFGPAASGCGCATGPMGTLAWLALGWAVVRSRRRSG